MNKSKSLLTVIFSAFAALLPIVGILAPKGVVVLLLITTVFAVPTVWRAEGRFPMPDRGIAAVLALLVVWCAAASLWNFEVTRSLLLALRIAVVFAAGVLLFAVAGTLNEAARTRIGQWLVAGVVLALAVMAVEIGLDYPLLSPFKKPAASSSHKAVWLNRGAITLALIAWPITAYLWGRGLGWKALFFPLLLGAILGLLESAAAILGVVVGAVAAMAALSVVSRRRLSQLLIVLASVLAFAGIPFAARALYDRGWHQADWLFSSARHRVEIWNFSAERIAERPLLGWGFDSSRHIGRLAVENGDAGRNVMALHPHNAPLQILLELGAIGAAITLALLWLLAVRLDNLALRPRVFGQALFIATAAVACVSFGMWQNWWLALIVSVALLVPLTAAPVTKAETIGTRPT